MEILRGQILQRQFSCQCCAHVQSVRSGFLLKKLSNHMVKNSHYKEHIMRSITESGSRRRQSREKRKKSLPVRKLLELERANNTDLNKKEIRISCEKCNEKIPAPAFVEHLRVCEQKLIGLAGTGGGGGGAVNSHSHHPPTMPTTMKSPPNKINHHHHHHQHDHHHRGSSNNNKDKDTIGGLEPPQDLSISTSNSSNNKGEKGDEIKNNNNKQQESSGSSSSSREPSSVLNAIEKMIEKSFDYRTKGTSNSNIGATPPIGTSILKRLGIDESVDYTKPLVDPSVLPIPPRYPHSRPRSVSSEKSDDTSKMMMNAPTTPSPSNSVGTNPDSIVAKEKIMNEDKSPRRSLKSPADGDSSGTEDSLPNSAQSEKSGATMMVGKLNSLSALSSMFESIGGGGGGNGSAGSSAAGNHDSAKSPTPSGNSVSSSGGGGGGNFPSNSHHPLAALQKLCDKTENTPAPVNSRPTSTSSSNPQSSPGIEGSALLGLNWSVNDGENVFKCTFCDTPFLSKGAYRHHLAKMHFVKEKSPSNGGKEEQLQSDSPTSKFIKYSELAKQLSSK